MQQVVQREALGKAPVFVPLGRADEAVQVLPQLAVAGLGRNALEQGLLALAAALVVGQLGADAAQLFAECVAAFLQRLQAGLDFFGRRLGQGLGLQLRVLALCGFEQGGSALLCRLQLLAQRDQALAFGCGQQGLQVGGLVSKGTGAQGGLPCGFGLGRFLALAGQRGLGLLLLALQGILLPRESGDVAGAFGQGLRQLFQGRHGE